MGLVVTIRPGDVMVIDGVRFAFLKGTKIHIPNGGARFDLVRRRPGEADFVKRFDPPNPARPNDR